MTAVFEFRVIVFSKIEAVLFPRVVKPAFAGLSAVFVV